MAGAAAAGGAPEDDGMREMHRLYLKRSLDCLPHRYEAVDLSRMTFVYFCVVGLDLLGALEETVGAAMRSELVEWVYNLQVPPARAHSPLHCGFKGGPVYGQPFDPARHAEAGYAAHAHDAGHIAMSYVALTTLVTLGDDLARVQRGALIGAIAGLQQPDGSFAACVDGNECDMRFLFCACAISFIMDDWAGVDQPRALHFIRSCQTFDGAFGLVQGQEAHGGSTFCAVASLALMGVLDQELPPDSTARSELVNWCLQRQVGGFQGRTNKDPDTCYSFWIGGTLELLGELDLADHDSTTSFVDSCEQRRMGGFGKVPGNHPDHLHSFYSLTWLSMVGKRSLRQFRCDLGICTDRFARPTVGGGR